MNFEIKIKREAKLEDHPDQRPVRVVTERVGVWSASNVHTAVKRALTGYPMEKGDRDIAGVGAPKNWIKLSPRESVIIEVRRL